MFEISGDVFIVPNKYSTLTVESKRWYNKNERLAKFEKLANLNNLENFDPDITKIVEIWVVVPEMTENLHDHGIYLDNEQYRALDHSIVPTELFEGKVEGDVVSIIIPLERCFKVPSEFGLVQTRKQINVKFNLRLAQREYRYRNFGNFEDVLRKVFYYRD